MSVWLNGTPQSRCGGLPCPGGEAVNNPHRLPRGVSIGTKLTIATLAVLLLVSVLLYRELTRRERQSLLAAKETAAMMVADLFAASLSAPLDFADNEAVETELRHLEQNGEVECAAVFLEGAKMPVAKIERGCDATAPIDASQVGRGIFHEDRVEVARLVVGRGNVGVGRARIVFSLARENAAFAESRRQIFWLTFLLAAGTAAVLIVISRTQIVSPLRRLSDAARRVGGGDLATRVDVRSTDELGQLATAFNRMSEEIGDRERRLAAATQNLRDLFDHMGQAIIAFDREGKVRGAVSRQATKLFGGGNGGDGGDGGDGREALEGRPVRELLFGAKAEAEVEAQAFVEWEESAFDVGLDAWAAFAELAPRETTLSRKNGPSVPLELEFRPVAKDGKVDRIMVLATDVSEKRQLERAVVTAEEQHAKRMAAMRRLVAGGAQLFVRYIAAARERVMRFFERLDEDALSLTPLDLATVEEIFRHVHTMKGEARAFDLPELEAAFEVLEDTLAALRKNGEALTQRDVADDAASAIRAGLFRAEAVVDRTRQDFVAASPIGSAALEQASVQRSDLEAVLALAGDHDDELTHAIKRLAARPFGEALATIAERAPDWAARDGKRVELVVEGREVRIPPALSDVLGGVMTHLVRNAVAHGIETEAERLAAGKPSVGSIWASAQEGEHGPMIVVEDDGAGIDLDRIVERARALGLVGATASDTAPANAAELVFLPGLSTRDANDGLAGRGIGLDAVRAYVREAGYTVHFVTEKGSGTKFVIEPIPPPPLGSYVPPPVA
ncbi:MAG: CheA-like histidine kinase, partial [Myxococcaceae bacterium]|nr:CheA-like histidine kinase [Myxococcaceae bacterium]